MVLASVRQSPISASGAPQSSEGPPLSHIPVRLFGDSVPVPGLFGGQVCNSSAGRYWTEWLAEGVEFSIFALP